MTPFSLYPAFTRINYRTAYAPHSMTLPNYGWSPVSVGHTMGTYLGADDVQYDALDVLEALSALLAEIFVPSTTIGEAIIYTMAAPVGQAIPRVSHDLATPGVNTNTTWAEAVQLQFTFRTAEFNKFKLVMLDVPADDDFNKYTSLSGLNVAYQNLADFITDPAGSFCGRDRQKPTTLVSMIHDLNDGLRKRYRLS
jgi:hypothetical protein